MATPQKSGERTVSIATGVSAGKMIRELALCLENYFSGLKIRVYEVTNEFFGGHVTVTGLLTGKDILSQLKGRDLGERLYISRSMLRAGEAVFLDDMTLEDLEKELEVQVIPVENNGRDFVDKVTGI